MGGFQKLHANFCNSLSGLQACWAENSFRLEVYALIFGVALVAWLDRPVWFAVLAVVSIVLVMMAEALNTAIERLCDRVTLEHDLQIKVVKDVASAGVLLAVLVAGLVWICFLVGAVS